MIKKLKDYSFSWNEEKKLLTIADNRLSESDFVQVDKVRMLSLMRFIFRVLAHLSVKHRKWYLS
jgi:hypothetical protein